MSSEPIHQLREVFRNYARTKAPDIWSFCGEALSVDHELVSFEPATLKAVSQIPSIRNAASVATQPLVDAVIEAIPHVKWQQSYTLEQQGIDEYYLDNYGWFNVIAPSGPFVSNDVRLSVGYWGKGLFYPVHWHEPEEIYLTLAGSTEYRSDGRAPLEGGPGTTVCHYSNQPHAADFGKSAALIAAVWRGNNLEKHSDFEKGNVDG